MDGIGDYKRRFERSKTRIIVKIKQERKKVLKST